MEEIEDCQAKLILTRSYDSKAKTVAYCCKDYNGTIREIIADVKGEPVERIVCMDQMILNSFSDRCHNCPNSQNNDVWISGHVIMLFDGSQEAKCKIYKVSDHDELKQSLHD